MSIYNQIRSCYVALLKMY